MNPPRLLAGLTLVSLLLVDSACGPARAGDLARYVNPFIGTAATGHTYPGATTPFGLVQVSPDTGTGEWKYCSGYRYEDTHILGFSHTHLSGTGCPELGDILLLPFTGEAEGRPYRSRISNETQSASPGYYAVLLEDDGIQAELTATAHAAHHRYSFPKAANRLMLLDLQHGVPMTDRNSGNRVRGSSLEVEDEHTVSGHTITDGWAGRKHVYFVIRFREPILDTVWLTDPGAERNHRVVFDFGSTGRPRIECKVGLSTVDIDGARGNLDVEMPGWHFARVRKAARAEWNRCLDRITIGGTQRQKEMFYSALYRTMLAPNNIADCDGRYRGADNQVYSSANGVYYSTLSQWDVYRAVNPLYSILYPEVANGIVSSMLAHFDVQGFLPIWTLWGHENFCMIGNHSIPIIADAYLKGIRDYDVEKAFEAIKTSSTVSHRKSDWETYTRYGYLPSDLIEEEAVSRTLEHAYDDSCVAAMARAMGRTEDAEVFDKRALAYRNLFDPSTGLMRGRNSDGSWVDPFDPYGISHAGTGGGDYTEGNAWQYTWSVQHRPTDLISMMGGESNFVSRLDNLFALESRVYGKGSTVDVTGLIGQYAHGNEPCHHVAYLYNFAGMPWKTQERIHQIVSTLYDSAPDGLCGNDDCGQMSAWLIFSMLGFYPVNPANGVYVLGSPSLDRARLKLPNGAVFTVETERDSPEDIYIQRVESNGKPWPYSYIRHEDVVAGGRLMLFMGAEPNDAFGRQPAHRPPES